MGIGAFLIAWPLLGEEGPRRRLSLMLLGLGIALGLWGLAQWFFGVHFAAAGDLGVRPGVDLTSGGHGQLQGGLYAFPVAVTLSFAALVSGRVRSAAARHVLVAVLLLNSVCLLLTYERTFWAATVVACLVATARLGRRAWRPALAVAGIGVVTLLVALVALGQTRTAIERVSSVSQYGVDQSLEFRAAESRAVAHVIAQRPLTGSGLGATITWGKEDVFATQTTPFSHDGYLWLAWKMGVPAAALLVLAVVVAALRPAPTLEDEFGLRAGAQAALLGLLLVATTFPPFNALGITAVMGFLAAVSLQPRPSPRRPLAHDAGRALPGAHGGTPGPRPG
jgi:O-antigen ligase